MANQFSVQPLGGLGNVQMIGQGMQGIAQNVQNNRAEEQRKELMSQAADLMERGNPQEIAAFSAQHPEVGKAMMGSIKFANDSTRSNMRDSMQRVVAGEDPTQVLQQRIQMVQEQGGDPSDSIRELEIAQQDPEAYRQQVEGIYAMSYPSEYSAFRKSTGVDDSGPDAPSNVREWQYYNSLPEEQQRQYLAMKRSGQMFRQGDVTMAVDPRTQTTAQPMTEAGAGPTTQAEVQAQLTDQQATKAASTKAAENAIAISDDAFKRLEPVKTAIANYDEAIDLVENKGANTGFLASKFPSIQQASIKLDNLQGRLGLDVIGNTTFGALSESELQFALDTALPKNLKGPELVKWLKKKKRSQEKLSRYLEDAAIYLGTPGNTAASFLEEKRARAQENKETERAAPPAALEYLQQNPSAIDAFEDKYGYRPEGF